jgi:hypothetical protein
MGEHVAWRPEFDKHVLAASQSNYRLAHDGAIEDRDYLTALCHLHTAATRINHYCDNFRVAGDDGAEYWLEHFLWWCDAVIHLDSYFGFKTGAKQ